MKRVIAITKGKSNCITNLLSRKADRIIRNVDQAIACAEDRKQDAVDSSENIINSFGTVAGPDDTMALQDRINLYLGKMAEVKDYEETIQALKDLKAKLQEDVQLEELEEEKKK